MIRVHSALILGALSLPTSGYAQVPSGQDLRQRLLEEWKQSCSGNESVIATRSRSSYIAMDGQPEYLRRTDWVTYVIKGQFRRFQFKMDEYKNNQVSASIEDMSITNSEYEAVLDRSKKDDKQWVFREMKSPSQAHAMHAPLLACPWLNCNNIIMPMLVADVAFVVVRVEAPIDTVTRVYFNYGGQEYHHCKSGWVDLDLNRHALILGYEFKTKTSTSEGTVSGKNEFDNDGASSVLTRSSIETEMVYSKYGKVKSREVTEYVTQFKPVDSREFYLTYYGIPEPVSVKLDKPIPTYVWLVGAAAILLVAAFAIRARHRLGLSMSRR